ncbi:hypothetical protein B0H34DRAFT_798924 [Crassisporium funariophilum]|nr:hypothetical protein B0H34DRAFT_798924 [Crassisporium funariophilum]
MMLVHKPQNALPSHPSPYSHRRHPSAPPTVLVQPTRTPGLLSLSKPAAVRQSPNRPLPSQQRNNNAKNIPKSKSTPVVRAPLLTPAAEIVDTKKPGLITLPLTPSPQSRGRAAQAKNARDKAQTHRSSSHSSIRGKHGRQPSPPISQSQLHQIPSQAEATVISSINSAHLFDPFLDNSAQSLHSPPPSPTMNFEPSGKLARRRQQQTGPPTPTKAVPVAIPRTHSATLSRSAPLPTNMVQRPRPIPKRSATTKDFPICDDLNEVADQMVMITPPATPRRHFDNGPSTAPLSARTPGAFPFNGMGYTSPPSPKKANRKHRRTPSEGVFHMSSDEDLSTGPGGVILNPNVKALFGLVGTPEPKMSTSAFATPSPRTPEYPRQSSSLGNSSMLSKEKQAERDAAARTADYFASSMFQNSPSPEELPDPLL